VNPTDEGSDARCAVLRAMHRLADAATTRALLSTTGLPPQTLDDALKSLVRDGWLIRDTSVLRAAGGAYRLSRELRRVKVEAEHE